MPCSRTLRPLLLVLLVRLLRPAEFSDVRAVVPRALWMAPDMKSEPMPPALDLCVISPGCTAAGMELARRWFFRFCR